MRKLLASAFTLAALLAPAICSTAQTGKTVKPDQPHLDWHETEFYLFFHFGPNTFTNMEWGHGTETEDVFNPVNLDCDQWCRIARAAGARGVIITAKHHDGFCLWPSAYSTHTVRESPWKNGNGDVLRELSDACRRNGLKFGVYLSPWDRNHPKYGTPDYNDVYAGALTELLTGYGSLFEVWWDGANGEGPNGKKQVYDFHRFEKLVKKYQPNALIFSDIGPGCRWAGNEQGTVGETNWCMLDTAGYGRGATGPKPEVLQQGQESGKLWIPAECDVSIRPGWFYHPEEDNQVKSPEALFQIYLQSVGRGANLILNVPPNRAGRLAPQDSASLVRFGEKVKHTFSRNMASGKNAVCKWGLKRKQALQITDGSLLTWIHVPAPRPGETATLEMDLGSAVFVDCIRIREELRRHGQRVRRFSVQAEVNGKWQEVARSTTVGPRKILLFDRLKAQKWRVVFEDVRGFAAISECELFDSKSGD